MNLILLLPVFTASFYLLSSILLLAFFNSGTYLNGYIVGWYSNILFLFWLLAFLFCPIWFIIYRFIKKEKYIGKSIIASFSSIFIGAFSYFIFTSNVEVATHIPTSSIYSNQTERYYYFVLQPVPTDHVWKIFSAPSVLSPFWKIEKFGSQISYSEDGSLTENPFLEVSKSGNLLAINRGGIYTDLIDLNESRLIYSIPWEFDKEKVHQIDTKIKKLLVQ